MKGFFRKYAVSLGITAAALILGILFGMQFRSTYYTKVDLASEQSKAEMYSAMIENEKKESRKLEKKLANATEKNKILIFRAKKRARRNNKFSKLEYIKFLAAMTSVKGEGVTITLDDASRDDIGMETEEFTDYIIHDLDVLRVINTLKSLGAQAIAINGERITSESFQICAGSTILVNKNKYVLPFTISAIGDTDTLYNGFIDSEIYNELIFFKMKAEIVKESELLLGPGVLK